MRRGKANKTEDVFAWSWALSNSDPSGFDRLVKANAQNRSVRKVFDTLIVAAGPSSPARGCCGGDYPKGIPIKVPIKELINDLKEMGITADVFANCVTLLETEGIMQDVEGLTACCASFSNKE